MRYAKIDNMEYTNGKGIGVSLYIQGCDFHCKGCFNPETWDFNGGQKWTKDVENILFQYLKNPHITRLSILGGEPLHDKNIRDLFLLLSKIKSIYPKINIWIYTGHKYENTFTETIYNSGKMKASDYRFLVITRLCDVLVDGQFDENKKDPSLVFKGSSNQRIIDIKKSNKEGKIILWRQ